MPRVTRTTLVNVTNEFGDDCGTAVPLESIFAEPNGEDFQSLCDAQDTLAWKPYWQCGGGASELFTIVIATPQAQENYLARLDFEHKCKAAIESIDAVTAHEVYPKYFMRFHRNDVSRAKIILASALMRVFAADIDKKEG